MSIDKKIEDYKVQKEVSIKYFCLRLVTSIDKRLYFMFRKPFWSKLYLAADREVESFLIREYNDIVLEYSQYTETAIPFDNCNVAPIWMCWLQGEDNAPDLARSNINRVKKLAESHPVNVVSMKSVDDYVDIPGRIIDLYRNDYISAAHFTDIVRYKLLETYGGLWLDASVFLVRKIDNTIFKQPFWIAKGLDGNFPLKPICYSCTEWEAYFQAAQRNSLFYSFMNTCLQEYFNKYKRPIDYLLPNYFAMLAIKQIPQITKEYQNIPQNNIYCESLNAYPMTREKTKLISKLVNSDTTFFKLSFKTRYDDLNGMLNVISEMVGE